MFDFICNWLGKYFDLPCSYTIDGQDVPDYMAEKCSDWCELNCGVASAGECWKQYFKMLKEDQE